MSQPRVAKRVPVPRVVKRVPAEWKEGQEIEQRAVRAFRPAFARAIRIIQAAIKPIIEQAQDDITFNVALAFSSLPWAAYSDELFKAWFIESERVINQSGRAALNDKPRVIKGRSVVLKLPDDEVRRISQRWAEQHALLLAEATTLGSAEGVRAALIQAINQNRSIVEVAEDIESMVGITSGDVAALGKLRTKLEKKGLSASSIDQKIRTKSNQYRRGRADNIARTEINAARNRGTLEVWKSSVGVGDLPIQTWKVWVANGACIICENIVMKGPVPLNEPFDSARGPTMHPPAHPSCRCSMGLTFPPLA